MKQVLIAGVVFLMISCGEPMQQRKLASEVQASQPKAKGNSTHNLETPEQKLTPEPKRPAKGNSAAQALAAATDKALPPTEATKRMNLPEGFQATLFAGEPDVKQPIAFAFDDRGRLWVAECYSYPKWQKEGHDRILIFEDSKGTGRFDTCKVFWDKGANITGLQVGFGGVWVCAIPNLLFIPIRGGADVPAGPPEVLLEGWDMKAKHNIFSSLTWGPDGWLYGCNGILSKSKVGKPGTPEAERVPFNCGVWRYHPIRRKFEVVAWGTTNPWGLDFDDHGQMFITNCVTQHLWHIVPGGHYKRMYGQDFNAHAYDLIPGCADHIHWAGGPYQSVRREQAPHSDAGGGHAHVGCMVYLGDNWPDHYRSSVFMCNVHGHRINHDTLERRGSGYVAHHAKDFMLANDPWFRGLAVQYGPDGGVFVNDLTETGECHNFKESEIDRTNGRIYKITFGKTTAWSGDIAALDDGKLVELQSHKNDWHVRHARRVLQERAAAGKLGPETKERLRKMLKEHPDATRKLRALWALHATGGLDEKLLLEQLDSPHETIRGWAIQLGLEERKGAPALLNKLGAMAAKDPSPFVHLYLASGLQRLPMEQRWAIAEGLIQHARDAEDSQVPLMVWYGIEPLVPADRGRALSLIAKARIPLIREHLARRIASLSPPGLEPLVQLLGRVDDAVVHADVLRGIQAALRGQRQVTMPEGWPIIYRKLAASPLAEVRSLALRLAVLSGDTQALAALRKVMMDTTAELAVRHNALQTLIEIKDAELVSMLQKLVAEPALRGPALRGLAVYENANTPQAILRDYAKFTDVEKTDARETLASRSSFALVLLNAIKQGRIPRRDLSATNVRQMVALNHEAVNKKLDEMELRRPPPKEKEAQKRRYKSLLTPDHLKSADRANGRLVFARTCASCHRMFGEGGDLGPELTGAQRHNLDYVLDKVLDPNAVVVYEYRMTLVLTKDGRVLTGIIKHEDKATVTVQTQNEKVVVLKNEIEKRERSALSMMPEGMFANLSQAELRDLIGYLASPAQVPPPP